MQRVSPTAIMVSGGQPPPEETKKKSSFLMAIARKLTATTLQLKKSSKVAPAPHHGN